MWDSDADKYWKEKLALKRRDTQKKRALGGLCGFAVLYLLYSWAMYASAPEGAAGRGLVLGNGTVGTAEPAVEEVVIPSHVLQTCKNDCRVKVIDHCNNICRFAHQELPRPTIFRSCQAPCIRVGHQVCDLATNEKKFFRNQCRNSGETLAFQVCKEYDNQLPRPRTQQVCQVGAKSAGPAACGDAGACLKRHAASEAEPVSPP